MGVSGGGGGGGGSSQGYDYQTQLQQQLSGGMQSIWGPQASALSGLYGQAGKTLQGQSGIQGAAGKQVGQVMPGAQAGMQGLQRLAAGGGPLSSYAAPNNALAKQQVAQLSKDIGQNFQREILPGIRSGAGLAGALGSSRDKLAQGVAAGDAAQAIASGASDLYAQQYGIGAQAAAGQTDAMLGAAGQLPGAAAQTYNLGMMPYQAAWAPLMSAAGIFGDPTALSKQFGISQSVGAGESWNKGSQGKTKPQWGFNLF